MMPENVIVCAKRLCRLDRKLMTAAVNVSAPMKSHSVNHQDCQIQRLLTIGLDCLVHRCRQTSQGDFDPA